MTEQATDEALDFQRAQYDAPPPAQQCHRCKQPIAASYYSVNGNGVCAACLELFKREQQSSFPKALLLGTAAGALGALLYYGWYVWQESHFGLFTVLIGVAVGIGVRTGGGGSRNIGYRLLAVAIAWIAMCLIYVPDMALPPLLAAVFSVVAPFVFIANGDILAILIFAFGLWEAYRLSAPRPFVVEGPFEPQQVQRGAAPVPSDAPPPVAS